MFSGIIEALGTIKNKQVSVSNTQITIISKSLNFKGIIIGDSIAVNGVCLTIINLTNNEFSVDLSNETIKTTTFASSNIGDIVNLERALTLNKALNGHLVAGHVDDVAILSAIKDVGEHTVLTIKFAKKYAKYIVVKGSICLNGVSLTLNYVNNNTFMVNIVPHTLKTTNISKLIIGDKINLEIDILARYIVNLIK